MAREHLCKTGWIQKKFELEPKSTVLNDDWMPIVREGCWCRCCYCCYSVWLVGYRFSPNLLHFAFNLFYPIRFSALDFHFHHPLFCCVSERLVLNGFQWWKMYWARIWILLFGASVLQMEMKTLGSVCLLKWIKRNVELKQFEWTMCGWVDWMNGSLFLDVRCPHKLCIFLQTE